MPFQAASTLGDAAVAVVDLDRLQLVLVLLGEVGEAEVAEGAFVAETPVTVTLSSSVAE